MRSDPRDEARGLVGSLATCRTDPATVRRSVDAHVGLRPGDVLLAVGSVVEGLSNRKSDLDLLLIMADDDRTRSDAERCWAVDGCMIDLRPIRMEAARDLAERLAAWARTGWNLLQQAPFSDDERLLLHRMLTGLEVAGPADSRDQPTGWRPDGAELARLKLQVARHLARTIQVDLVGYREDRDFASLVFAAQDLLGHGVDGLLAGHGFTNPNPKWRSRYLDRLAPDWSRPAALPVRSRSARRTFWDLHRAPQDPTETPAGAHALRCVTFTRSVLALAEVRLVAPSGVVHDLGTWSSFIDPLEGVCLPALELDVDFFLGDESFAVGRLNEFGPSLRLSLDEFGLLLLFDGETSIRQPTGPVTPGRSAQVDVAASVERAMTSGLCLTQPAGPVHAGA